MYSDHAVIKSIFFLFIPMAGCIDIFGCSVGCSVDINCIYNGKFEKAISCLPNQNNGIKRIGAGKLAPILAVLCYNAV